jgi:thioredoxin 1
MYLRSAFKRFGLKVVKTEEAAKKALAGSTGKLTVGWFTATWCGPCKSITKNIEKMSEDMKDSVEILKLDVDEFSNLAGEYQVNSVPTFFVTKDGEVLEKVVGAQSDRVKDAILKHIN